MLNSRDSESGRRARTELAAESRGIAERNCMGTPPNKALLLTSAEHIERSRPIPGARRTRRRRKGR